MTLARTHRSLIGWMLFAFILCNGLACSLCHGQMLGEFSQPTQVEHAMAHADMPGMDDMGKMNMAPTALKSMDNACSFAATVALALIFFITLSWLIRRVRAALAPSLGQRRPPPRYLIPALQPQAP